MKAISFWKEEGKFFALLVAAGAIAVFVSQESVMKYLGAKANPILAYGVAS